VVATDVRGCREVVDPGRTGTLVPRGDADAIAGALRDLGAGTRRSELGQAGHRRARKQFDERRVVEIVLDTYREVGRRKAVPLPGL
jgi:glycosyltransferase involved in cell wall biosynthesis